MQFSTKKARDENMVSDSTYMQCHGLDFRCPHKGQCMKDLVASHGMYWKRCGRAFGVGLMLTLHYYDKMSEAISLKYKRFV